MRRHLVLLLLIGTACARPAGSCAAQPASVLLRGRGEPVPAGWQAIWAHEHDVVVATLGLRPLRASLPAGEREVRIWIAGSMGYPRHLYRLRIAGPTVRGQLFHYWRKDEGSVSDSVRYEALVRRNLSGFCETIVSSTAMEACPARLAAEPDWAGALAQAEAAGLWVLPDEDSLPSARRGTDGWTVIVELAAGGQYRTYKYHSPAPDVSPESGRALRIARAFQSARPPP